MTILILFAVFANGSQSAVRVGFDSPITCTVAAKEMVGKLVADHPDAKVTWACVAQ